MKTKMHQIKINKRENTNQTEKKTAISLLSYILKVVRPINILK